MPRNTEMEICKREINERLKFGTVSFTGRDILKEALNIKPVIKRYVTINLPIALAYPIFDLSFIRNDPEFEELLTIADDIVADIRNLGLYIQERADAIHANIPAIDGDKVLLLENIEEIQELIDEVRTRKNGINRQEFQRVIPLLIQNFKNQISEQVRSGTRNINNANVYNDLEEFLESKITVDKIFYDKINPHISIFKDVSYECLEDETFYRKIMMSSISDDIKYFFRRYRELYNQSIE
ncbi:MAG: hypothetical protein ACRCWG_03995 [Sarcina sp.]